MELDRIGMPERIALAGAAVLFISLFLPWYGFEGDLGFRAVGADDSLSAWQALGLSDLLLALSALGTAALVVPATRSRIGLDAGTALQVQLALAGVVLVTVLFRFISVPGSDSVLERRFGLFVAVLAAGAMAYAAYAAHTRSPQQTSV